MQLNLLPANKDLYIGQGAIYSKEFTVGDGNNLVDLTGTTFKCNIKRYAGVASEAITSSSSIVNALGGLFRLDISAAQTMLLKHPRYVYEIVATDSIISTQVVKIMYGQIYVENF